ncbi:8939_t:CDS:2, partial [Gigaspora margarita]
MHFPEYIVFSQYTDEFLHSRINITKKVNYNAIPGILFNNFVVIIPDIIPEFSDFICVKKGYLCDKIFEAKYTSRLLDNTKLFHKNAVQPTKE